MQLNDKNRKIIMWVSSTLSVLILIPIYFLVKHLMFAKGLMNADGAEPETVDKILSFSISRPDFLIPELFLLVILIVQVLIATYFIVKAKNNQEKVFGYLTLIFGGLSLPLIYLLIKSLVKKNLDFKVHSTIKKYTKIGTLIAVPPLVVAPFVLVSINKGWDEPTSVGTIYMNPNETNIIEIFTDGFDPFIMKDKLVKDKELKDFTLYDKFIAPGAETSFSMPIMMNGENENTFTQKDNSSSSSMVDVYNNQFGRVIKTHLDREIGNKKTRLKPYLVSALAMGNSKSFMQSISGDPKGFEKIKADNKKSVHINTINWGEAKEVVNGKFGIKNYSPDSMYYEYLNKGIKVNKNAKPVRILLQDMITHSPRITSATGGVTTTNGEISKENSGNGLKANFDRLIRSLKDKGLYDKSFIIIYGDHSNHSNTLVHPNKDIPAKKYNSMMMIKYPNENNNNMEISKTEVYGGFINQIIDHYDDQTFINMNKNFKPNKRVVFYGDEAAMVKFESGVLVVDKNYNSNGFKNGWIHYKNWKQHKDAILNTIRWVK